MGVLGDRARCWAFFVIVGCFVVELRAQGSSRGCQGSFCWSFSGRNPVSRASRGRAIEGLRGRARIPNRVGISGRGAGAASARGRTTFRTIHKEKYNRAKNGTGGEGRRVRAGFKKAVLQFRDGVNETSVPDVRLTKAKDGTYTTANFVFERPDIITEFLRAPLEKVLTGGFIQGLFMVDEEGVVTTYDVDSVFTKGVPSGIVARYKMTSSEDWDRFMRFMTRYSEANGLKFKPARKGNENLQV